MLPDPFLAPDPTGLADDLYTRPKPITYQGSIQATAGLSGALSTDNPAPVTNYSGTISPNEQLFAKGALTTVEGISGIVGSLILGASSTVDGPVGLVGASVTGANSVITTGLGIVQMMEAATNPNAVTLPDSIGTLMAPKSPTMQMAIDLSLDPPTLIKPTTLAEGLDDLSSAADIIGASVQLAKDASSLASSSGSGSNAVPQTAPLSGATSANLNSGGGSGGLPGWGSSCNQ